MWVWKKPIICSDIKMNIIKIISEILFKHFATTFKYFYIAFSIILVSDINLAVNFFSLTNAVFPHLFL